MMDFVLPPEQYNGLKRMSQAMRDMHSALYSGHLRAFVFPYPLYIVSPHSDNPTAAHWVQFNWVGDAVEAFTLDLNSLDVTVRTIEPYVFSSLDEDQKAGVLRGTDTSDTLCDVFDVAIPDVERYVSENMDYWEDRALSRPGLAG